MVKKLLSFLFFVCIVFLIFSCQKETFSTSGNIKLKFAPDTVSFDTIFTTFGSTTQRLRIKNPSNHSINISRIYLAGGENSPFRLNINGVKSYEDRDVRISKGDSLYIFVEVTVDPTNQDNPMIVQDSIIFELNGNQQDVDLIAYGQDFHLFNGDVLNSQHWKNDKPYLIYNSVLVDSMATLTIDPGCRIYFHHESSLFVKGTLKVEGTYDEPVNFAGDRLEQYYDDKPGQWGAVKILDDKSLYIFGGIHFLTGSKDNRIDHAIIKNANKGIQVDSVGNSTNPVLILSNTIIKNMTLNCLDARTTRVKADNCIFANSGSYSVALRFGGKYEFDHCTVANYYNGTRQEPSLVINNYYKYNSIIYAFDLEKAIFSNCIIYGEYGGNGDEILLDGIPQSQFNYQFQNCLLKTDPTHAQETEFKNSIFNKDPRFVVEKNFDYAIDSLSPARNIGDLEIAKQFPLDLNNESRLADEGPDLGALEWVPAKDEK